MDQKIVPQTSPQWSITTPILGASVYLLLTDFNWEILNKIGWVEKITSCVAQRIIDVRPETADRLTNPKEDVLVTFSSTSKDVVGYQRAIELVNQWLIGACPRIAPSFLFSNVPPTIMFRCGLLMHPDMPLTIVALDSSGTFHCLDSLNVVEHVINRWDADVSAVKYPVDSLVLGRLDSKCAIVVHGKPTFDPNDPIAEDLLRGNGITAMVSVHPNVDMSINPEASLESLVADELLRIMLHISETKIIKEFMMDDNTNLLAVFSCSYEFAFCMGRVWRHVIGRCPRFCPELYDVNI
ncbi:MAG: hypothetical protein JSS82_00085 [Bacteroidetes bacterium]|nr:hypothetical protein [Bacteroidota bacterium]